MSTTDVGLRQRRKQETRAHLSAVATLAFIERGFDQVTIAEIARRAGVSKMTVTNYFPLKEDLVFDLSDHIVAGPASAVRTRPPGESLDACLLRAYGEALDRDDPTLGHLGVEFSRMVAASPALRARAREIAEQRATALAEAIAEEPGSGGGSGGPGDPVGVAMAARVLAGAFETLSGEAQRRLMGGEAYAEIVAALRAAAPRVLASAGRAVEALTTGPGSAR